MNKGKLCIFFITITFWGYSSCVQKDTARLKPGVYQRESSSSIGYVVIYGKNANSGQNIIVRNKNDMFIDRGSIKFKGWDGMIHLENSFRAAYWINKTTFTTDDGNVTWKWVRSFEKSDLGYIR